MILYKLHRHFSF